MPKKFFNPFPKYLQIREILVRRFGSEFAPGDKLPAEHELCASFGVSRETVRDALRGLEEKGIIKRERGRGTFLVKVPDRIPVRRFTGLVEDFTELGLDTEARVLSSGPTFPPGDVAEALSQPKDREMFRILRIRYLEGIPLALHDSLLPMDIGAEIAGVDLGQTTLFEEIGRHLGRKLQEEYQSIDAVTADASTASSLGVSVGAPLLVVRRVFELGGDTPPMFFESHFRSDRYYFTVQLAQEQLASKDAAKLRSVNQSALDEYNRQTT